MILGKTSEFFIQQVFGLRESKHNFLFTAKKKKITKRNRRKRAADQFARSPSSSETAKKQRATTKEEQSISLKLHRFLFRLNAGGDFYPLSARASALTYSRRRVPALST